MARPVTYPAPVEPLAISFARYAELLAYDDHSETLYLEIGSAPPTMAC